MSGIVKYKKRKIICIANNSQRYITFSLGGLRFIDSLQLMNAFLELLVDNLTKDEFKFLHKFIEVHNSKSSFFKRVSILTTTLMGLQS